MSDSICHEFVYEAHKPERLDKIIRIHVGEDVSREKIKKHILAGACHIDDTACTNVARKVMPGQSVRIIMPPENSSLTPEDGDVAIVWQDDQIMVINKPAGLTVHPAPSCLQGTLVQRVLSICPALREHEGWRPGIVHRLDKDTSGLILVAPDEGARLKLAEAFAQRAVEKTYLALVSGAMHPLEGDCLEPMGRHATNKTKMDVVPEGRHAHTGWTTLYIDPGKRFSLLAVRLYTGRTHQIRVHMAHLGHPLLGDSTYAPRDVASMAPRQMLHAWKLTFAHPRDNKPLSFVCPPPEDMLATMRALSRHVERAVITGLPGCGKSRLTRMMADEGFPTWSADEVVRLSYEPGGDGWQLIHHRYRGRFTTKGQPVDKAALTSALRETPGMRQELEALIHPLVNSELEAFWLKADQEGHALAFAEVPLWPETHGHTARGNNAAEKVSLIGVRCPESTRHQRLMGKRGWSEDLIAAADSWQWPEEKKMAACDYIVDNSGDEDALLTNGRRVIRTLLDKQAEQAARLTVRWEALWKA